MRRPPRTDLMVQFFQSVRWSSSFATLHSFPHVNPAPFGAKFWQLLFEFCPAFRDFRVLHPTFGIAVVRINGLITNDKFCLSRVTQLHLGYCRLPEHRKQVLACLSSYPCGKEISSPQGGLHEPPVEDQTS